MENYCLLDFNIVVKIFSISTQSAKNVFHNTIQIGAKRPLIFNFPFSIFHYLYTEVTLPKSSIDSAELTKKLPIFTRWE